MTGRALATMLGAALLVSPQSFAVLVAETGFNDDAGINSDPIPDSPYTLGAGANGQPSSEPGWAGPWSVQFGSASNASIESSVVLEGDGALRLQNVVQVDRQLVEAQLGTFTVSQWFRASAGSDMTVYFGNAGGLVPNKGPVWNLQPDGTFLLLDGVGDSNHHDIITDRTTH